MIDSCSLHIFHDVRDDETIGKCVTVLSDYVFVEYVDCAGRLCVDGLHKPLFHSSVVFWCRIMNLHAAENGGT